MDIQVSLKVDNQSFVGSSGELVRMELDTADTRHSSGEETTSGRPADIKPTTSANQHYR